MNTTQLLALFLICISLPSQAEVEVPIRTGTWSLKSSFDEKDTEHNTSSWTIDYQKYKDDPEPLKMRKMKPFLTEFLNNNFEYQTRIAEQIGRFVFRMSKMCEEKFGERAQPLRIVMVLGEASWVKGAAKIRLEGCAPDDIRLHEIFRRDCTIDWVKTQLDVGDFFMWRAFMDDCGSAIAEHDFTPLLAEPIKLHLKRGDTK